MADDPGRRSEPAGARQLREARRNGQVARSRDLGIWANLAATLVVLWIGRDFWLTHMQFLASLGIQQASLSTRSNPPEITSLMFSWGRSLVLLALPIPMTCLATSILVNGTFNRWLFAPAAALPNFDRLNPSVNLRRMVGSNNGVELLKSIIKIFFLGTGLWLTIAWALPSLVRLPLLHSISLPGLLERILAGFLMFSLTGLGLLAAFDVWYQRFSYVRDLRMTPEEKKRDQRQDEGDPAQRARRRQLMREVAQESPLERCAYASMIVYSAAQPMAVAIYWASDSVAAPWLLNKGCDAVARAIIQIASDHQLALVEDADLCGRIYRQTGIDADLNLALVMDLGRYR